ncbi:MAG TPA: amidohydrolase family protein [Bradyrhizobium sp.]|nr:amidohydrolase family protein [Bradyrhizobium sp.]
MHDPAIKPQPFRGCLCCMSALSSPMMPRRKFLAGMAATGLGAVTAGSPMRSARADIGRRLIDVHSHIIPPFYLSENRDRIAGSRGGEISRAWLEWTPQQSLAAMDAHGVQTAILSLSSPGVWFGDAQEARTLSRRINEYGAELVRTHRGRFGLFAAIPLPDTEGSLREIEYAFDVLKADGIGLLTSYGDKWLGDPAYRPVLEELNRRHALVFVHPTTPNCCRALLPGIATLMEEVPQDTARTIVSLLFSGTLTQLKNIRFVFCHGGGTMPVLAARMTHYGPKNMAEVLPNGVEYELKRLYYDVAVSGYRPAIAALTGLVPMSQILFGSDFPYRPLGESADTLPQLGLSETDLAAIGRDNAIKLLPRLKAD